MRPEARGSFLHSAGAVLYFDNSSAFPRSITNQVRGRKSDESLTSAISAAEKQKLAVSYIFVSTTQISARSSGMSWKAWGGRGSRSAPCVAIRWSTLPLVGRGSGSPFQITSRLPRQRPASGSEGLRLACVRYGRGWLIKR